MSTTIDDVLKLAEDQRGDTDFCLVSCYRDHPQVQYLAGRVAGLEDALDSALCHMVSCLPSQEGIWKTQLEDGIKHARKALKGDG